MVIIARDTKAQLGYKQTEVGIIPKEWNIVTLGSCLLYAPQYGINAPAVPYTDSLPIYIRITDITDDGYFSPEKMASVNHISSNKYLLSDGDLVFARTGASVGKTYLYKSEDGTLVFAGYLIRVKVNSLKLLPNYLAAYVKTGHYWGWVKEVSMRSGQPGINGNEYKQLLIPLPPLAEQQAITTALSDVDALIASLDKLIAKKRDIKQATMQQLLINKGLIGSNSQGNANLGDFVELNPSKTHIDNTDLVTFIGMEDVSENGRIIRQKVMPLTSIKKGLTFFERNDVLVAKITPCFENGKGACVDTLATKFGFGSTEFHVLRMKKNVVPRYIFYHTQTMEFRQRLEAEMIGTAGQKRVPAGAIINYVLPIAHPLEEQQTIATILSDMDAEIAALEQRRNKTRALKQGIMQELLTGKTRLL